MPTPSTPTCPAGAAEPRAALTCCCLPRHQGQRPEQENPGPKPSSSYLSLSGGTLNGLGLGFLALGMGVTAESASWGPAVRRCTRASGPGPLGSGQGHSGAPVTVTFQVTWRPQRDLRPLSQVHTCSGKLDNCSLQSGSPPPPPVQCPCPVCPTPSCRCVGAAGKLGDPGPLTTTEGASRVGHRGWLGPFLIIALDAAYLE